MKRTLYKPLYIVYRPVLSLGGNDNSYNGEVIDLGEATFNAIFQGSDYHIIRRDCELCDAAYQELYYRRLITPELFNAYSYLKGDITINDEILVDFVIFTSIQTALRKDYNGAWYGCEDPPRNSAFGECYRVPNEFVNCQYPLDADDNITDPNLISCNKPVLYSIFVGDPEYVGVLDAKNALTNEEQKTSGSDNDGGYVYEIENNDASGNKCMVVYAERLDLIIIFVIGAAVFRMNVIFIALKCGCCKCKDCKSVNYKFKTVKFIEDNIEDAKDEQDQEIDMEENTTMNE